MELRKSSDSISSRFSCIAGEIKKLIHDFFTGRRVIIFFELAAPANRPVFGVDKEIHQYCGNMAAIMPGAALI